jgi:hypothetical protein
VMPSVTSIVSAKPPPSLLMKNTFMQEIPFGL